MVLVKNKKIIDIALLQHVHVGSYKVLETSQAYHYIIQIKKELMQTVNWSFFCRHNLLQFSAFSELMTSRMKETHFIATEYFAVEIFLQNVQKDSASTVPLKEFT